MADAQPRRRAAVAAVLTGWGVPTGYTLIDG